jgi:hypothetical protein
MKRTTKLGLLVNSQLTVNKIQRYGENTQQENEEGKQEKQKCPSASFAWKFTSITDEMGKHLERYEKVRKQLVEKYGTEGEDGTKQVDRTDKEKYTKFIEELNEVFQETVTMEIPEITPEDFDKEEIKLSIREIQTIRWMFEDWQEDDEPKIEDNEVQQKKSKERKREKEQ